MRKYLAIAVGIAGLAGCSSHIRQDTTPDLSRLGEQIARSICPGPATSVEQVPNQHMSGQIDTLETRTCSAGTSTIYKGQTTSDPTGLEVAASLRVAWPGIPSYLQIGQPVEPALAALGQPDSTSASSASYELGAEGLDTVTIHFANARITSIQWSWFLE